MQGTYTYCKIFHKILRLVLCSEAAQAQDVHKTAHVVNMFNEKYFKLNMINSGESSLNKMFDIYFSFILFSRNIISRVHIFVLLTRLLIQRIPISSNQDSMTKVFGPNPTHYAVNKIFICLFTLSLPRI